MAILCEAVLPISEVREKPEGFKAKEAVMSIRTQAIASRKHGRSLRSAPAAVRAVLTGIAADMQRVVSFSCAPTGAWLGSRPESNPTTP